MSADATQVPGLRSALPATETTRTRRAVLAGVGEAHNRPDAGGADASATTLAAASVRTCIEDLGSPGALGSVDMIAMTVGSDDVPDPAGALREALGLGGASTMVAAIGIPQQRLVSHAVLAVERGEAEAFLVVGSEAKASALSRKRSGEETDPPRCGPGADRQLSPDGEFMADAEVAAMLWDPVAQYALIDSALAVAEGLPPFELSAQVSQLWARFAAVAEANPEARFTTDASAAEALATTTEDNRLLAFPYNKRHSTQWAIDHAAALLICSEDFARRHGADAERLLHPLVALDSSWGLTLSRREKLQRWPAMRVMGEIAADHVDAALSEIAEVELYSCFPAAVRVQQRELGLPLDGTPTVLGGMAFAGGPFNHFTYMATAALARRLRDDHGDLAMLTTVSGMLTKGGLMVWGREPHPQGALVADVAEEVRAATGVCEVADFDAAITMGQAGRPLAATITGGFDPRLFAICEDSGGVRHLVSEPAPDGDPADVLASVLAKPSF